MTSSRQPRRTFGGESLFAVATVALTCAACQADISGGSEMPGGSIAEPGVAPGVTNPTDVPEPSDWFTAVRDADCSAEVQPSRTRIRRLSTTQWKNTVARALGVDTASVQLPEDAVSSATGFNTDAVINKVNVLLANAYFDAGSDLAQAAAGAAIQAYPCLSMSAQDTACSGPFIEDFGGRLFRRPLTEQERSRYAAFLGAQAALDPAETAVGTVLRALLLSPNAIYITELGSSAPGEVALTAYEQASIISYNIADMPPDQALLQAAASGSLGNAAERAAHSQRLLQTPGARAKYADFWRQYLPLGDLRKATDLDPSLAAAIEDETQQHFDKIVWQQNGGFADLVTAPYTYGAQTLTTLYGALTPTGTGAFSLPAGQRSGFLTQAGFLFSSDDSTVEHKVIHRGLTVRKRLLCQSPPPPPANLMPQASDLRPLGEDATPLESYEAFRMAKPACAACHSTFQPIGLAFETYDGMGRYRTAYEGGKPIVTGGELMDAGDASGPYADAVEIAQRIGNSDIGEYCFSRQYAEFALGRRLNAAVDACLIRAPSEAVAKPPIQTLAVVLSDIAARTNRVHN